MSGEERSVGRLPAMPDEDRRHCILQASERVFAVSGYGAATMEEIARESGMAKKTVYKFFPDKLSVFSALIESHDTPQFSGANAEDGCSPDEMLRELLLDVARFVLSPRHITLTRLVISEARNTPELARHFYEGCILRTHTYITGQIARHGLATLKPGLDYRSMADMLLGSTLGILHLRALMLDMDGAAVERELQDRVSATLAMMSGLPSSLEPAI